MALDVIDSSPTSDESLRVDFGDVANTMRQHIQNAASNHVENFYKEHPEYEGRSLESLGLKCEVRTIDSKDYNPISFTVQIVPL